MQKTDEPAERWSAAANGGVVIVADEITPDLYALRDELRGSSIPAEVFAMADAPADWVPRVAPGCLVADLRGGDAVLAFLGSYCSAVSRDVLVVSALTDTAARVRAVELGVADHLVAPFELVEGVTRIRRIVARAHRRSPKITAGDITIDVALRHIERAHEAVELTTREFAVLLALVQETPRVLSKRELLQNVWEGVERTPNLVEATVSSLRRKLERCGPRVVHTQHGYGYSFRPARVPRRERLDLAGERQRLVRERIEIVARRDRAIAGMRDQLARARTASADRRRGEDAGGA